ncbi:CoA ester lyase [Streptomyces sp. WMMB 322]|uniref:HpcH/HpaI aldolase/citrate lyase family protein n=1 Tax=Streptomyces sp. WMMB 322 TaxID=1286821 RepID=UPI0006E435E1|nr:CoA ester lyase [Streptomyces sp. WMMB 322]SCK57291.1 citrate lyase subunit beta / citryl-CoA lyase [Streptomyces sp. WMMB 322]
MDVGRTLLFVPGDRPDRIAKALTSGADAVAVDFEDAVGEASKETARALTAEALTRLAPAPPGGAAPGASGAAVRPAVLVRINALETPEAEADLAAVASLLGTVRLDGLIVPKAESVRQLDELDARLTAAEAAAGTGPGELSLLPVVETAAGVLASAGVAAAGPRVHAVLFGTLDLAAGLGVRPSVEGRELLHARSQLVLAARAAGLTGILDGPYAALDDENGLARSTLAARELGFTGRAVLHPRQLAPVRAAFTPTDAELDQARAVLAAHRDASGRGAAAVRLSDGTFVDRPVVARAEALLRESGRHGAEAGS